jgi:Glycosyl hydrolases family 2, TIM barrel domain
MNGQTVFRLLLGLLLLARMHATAGAPPNGQFELDLASDTAWTARLDGGAPRPIKVPGGGWNSDVQQPPIQVLQDVRDFVLYERKVTIPEEAAGKVVKLLFGAVNYGAEILWDEHKVGEHHGPLMPFAVDVSGNAAPGTEHTLKVRAFHRRHYIRGRRAADVPVGFDFPRGRDEASLREGLEWFPNWNGNSKFAYGITKYVKLRIEPSVAIQDCFIRTSVTGGRFSAQIWITNATDKARELKLNATLSSWKSRNWTYPAIAGKIVEIGPHTNVSVTLGPTPWTLGPESYWWPNVPFREDYEAELHHLDLVLTEGANIVQRKQQRFGFVEHAEGPYFYTVNGVRVTGFSDATTESQSSFFDAYSRAAAWLPPTKPGTGCPETWRRYLRVGMNCNRICCSMPTEYMMETADEAGFMLIPETPIWGNGVTRFHTEYTPQCVREMLLACRNHPSVARYSLANEPREKRDESWPWRALIDAAMTVDDTRPYVFELEKSGNGRIDGFSKGHAYVMEHYVPITSATNFIRGMGEHDWSTDGLESFAVTSQMLRVNDWAYFAPWSWLNYWPNFLEGMSHELHAWKNNNHADRVDGVDGWGSTQVAAVQKSLHPYLVLDRQILEDNPWDMDGVLPGGVRARRQLEVFNGGLKSGRFELKWSIHWDKADGPVAAEGVEAPIEIEAGFHATRSIAIQAPPPPGGARHRAASFVVRSIKDGVEVFTDDRVTYEVLDRDLASRVQFLGVDDRTHGDWGGHFGRDGHELFGRSMKIPGYAVTAWLGDEILFFTDRTQERRVLENAVGDAADGHRTAAVRYANSFMRLTVSVGDAPRRLSLYFLDWGDDRLRSEVLVREPGGVVLDRRPVSDYRDGKYLSWTVRGTVQLFLRNASVAGLFFDPAGKD